MSDILQGFIYGLITGIFATIFVLGCILINREKHGGKRI
jgi:hypothetical protein